MCRASTRVYVHCLDCQYNNFLYVFFFVKKWPLYLNFNIPPSRNMNFFSMFHTSCRNEILGVCT
jgi:hypothetical protein